MSSSYECIGITAPDLKSFNRVVGIALSRAIEDAPPRAPFRHTRWTDPSGASLGFHLRCSSAGTAIDCVTPFFEPQDTLSRWRVRSDSPAVDACEHCSGVDCYLLDDTGEIVTAATVQLLNFLPYKAWLNAPHEYELEVSAFAHDAAFYRTHAEFEEGQREWWGRFNVPLPLLQDGRPLLLAENGFLSEGMNTKPDANITRRATVLFAGRVEYSQQLTSTLTGGEFQHVRIKTLPGALDTVLVPFPLS